MRYIHGKDWDAKLTELLISERIEPGIHFNVPNIQIFGTAGSTSTGYLIVLKKSMTILETNGDKEGPSTHFTQCTKGERSCMSILNPLGETKGSRTNF